MQSSADSPGSGTGAALLDRARELLDDVATWRLPPAAWSRPAAAVEALAAAYGAGDADALAAAVSRLEVLSPNRVERIVDPADIPPPEPLRERVTALVHTIAEQAEDATEEPDRDDDRS
ncbi:CATRA system-associated protein [Streptomyces sp. NPDC094468]|uniref:CATRA system-associated protein n=1 Tax=Streptomyces sp. NPDC094468 TaxID=3366066 RepID=UPI003820A44E